MNNDTNTNRNITKNEYHASAHLKYLCRYHVIFCPKYRRKIFVDGIDERLKETFKDISASHDFEILEMEVMPDHVHLLLRIPPKMAVSSFMGYLNGKSALMIFDRHANLNYKFWNRHFRAEGYYVSTAGLNEATIRKYIV